VSLSSSQAELQQKVQQKLRETSTRIDDAIDDASSTRIDDASLVPWIFERSTHVLPAWALLDMLTVDMLTENAPAEESTSGRMEMYERYISLGRQLNETLRALSSEDTGSDKGSDTGNDTGSAQQHARTTASMRHELQRLRDRLSLVQKHTAVVLRSSFGADPSLAEPSALTVQSLRRLISVYAPRDMPFPVHLQCQLLVPAASASPSSSQRQANRQQPPPVSLVHEDMHGLYLLDLLGAAQWELENGVGLAHCAAYKAAVLAPILTRTTTAATVGEGRSASVQGVPTGALYSVRDFWAAYESAVQQGVSRCVEAKELDTALDVLTRWIAVADAKGHATHDAAIAARAASDTPTLYPPTPAQRVGISRLGFGSGLSRQDREQMQQLAGLMQQRLQLAQEIRSRIEQQQQQQQYHSQESPKGANNDAPNCTPSSYFVLHLTGPWAQNFDDTDMGDEGDGDTDGGLGLSELFRFVGARECGASGGLPTESSSLRGSKEQEMQSIEIQSRRQGVWFLTMRDPSVSVSTDGSSGGARECVLLDLKRELEGRFPHAHVLSPDDALRLMQPAADGADDSAPMLGDAIQIIPAKPCELVLMADATSTTRTSGSNSSSFDGSQRCKRRWCAMPLLPSVTQGLVHRLGKSQRGRGGRGESSGFHGASSSSRGVVFVCSVRVSTYDLRWKSAATADTAREAAAPKPTQHPHPHPLEGCRGYTLCEIRLSLEGRVDTSAVDAAWAQPDVCMGWATAWVRPAHVSLLMSTPARGALSWLQVHTPLLQWSYSWCERQYVQQMHQQQQLENSVAFDWLCSVVEEILSTDLNGLLGIRACHAILIQQRERETGGRRACKTQLKQRFFREKRLADEMGLPPPPTPDFNQLAIDATPHDPAVAALLRKHSAMLQLLQAAIALLWRCAQQEPQGTEGARRGRERALWLDALHSSTRTGVVI
jgi:hypothetical protein